MTVKLNHTIVAARDKRAAATFLAEILGLPAPAPFGPFLAVKTGNDVTLDFLDDDEDIAPQHYAFLVSEKEFDELLTQAGREIAEQIATNVLIIEDEPIIAMDVEHIVRSLGHDVAGIARTHNEAVAIARKGGIGLVLADIQLADGSSGINAVNEILQNIELPVIFITAYPERLLTGERPEPTFLITKPFQRSTVKAQIAQALFFDTATVPV